MFQFSKVCCGFGIVYTTDFFGDFSGVFRFNISEDIEIEENLAQFGMGSDNNIFTATSLTTFSNFGYYMYGTVLREQLTSNFCMTKNVQHSNGFLF